MKTPITIFVDLTLAHVCTKIDVSLTRTNPKRITTLGLPGTIEQRIVSLNDALSIFSRLRKLDLSRNALSSLTGLETLSTLEELILYYNLVSSIDELKKLQKNSQLKILDIRLNPVSKLDYRGTILKLLPCLEILDDRLVSYPERKLANSESTRSELYGELLSNDQDRFSEILRRINETNSPAPTNSITVSVHNSESSVNNSPSPKLSQIFFEDSLNQSNGPHNPLVVNGDEISKTASYLFNLFEYHSSNSISISEAKNRLQPLIVNELKRLVDISKQPKYEDRQSSNEVSRKLRSAYVEWGCQTDSSILNSELIPLSEVDQVKTLKVQLERSQSQVNCVNNMNKITSMLQESHDVLVRTNANLVREIDELRQKRAEEEKFYKRRLKSSMLQPSGINSGDESEF